MWPNAEILIMHKYAILVFVILHDNIGRDKSKRKVFLEITHTHTKARVIHHTPLS